MVFERGKKDKALKIVIYGPEGIGKGTFASKFPGAVFIDTEGSTNQMDVIRMPQIASYADLLMQVDYCIQNAATEPELSTLVIDTADWAERLCIEQMIAKQKASNPNFSSIEDYGYGKGYAILAEEFGRLLDKLTRLTEQGVTVVLTAHAAMRNVSLPDEMGTYDRWEMKLQKKTAPLVKEWADMLLFANYQTMIVKDGNTMNKKGKGVGGQRVMYTTHHTCWDAKNRFGLPDQMPFDYSGIAGLIKTKDQLRGSASQPITTPSQPVPQPAPAPAPAPAPTSAPMPQQDPDLPPEFINTPPVDIPAGTHPALASLMTQCMIREDELRKAVSDNRHYPYEMPITAYPENYINGFLVPNWDKVRATIEANRMPF